MLSRNICPSSTVSKPLRLLPPPKSFHHTPPYSLKQIRLSQPCFRLPPQTPDRQRTTIARRNGSSLALHSEPLFQPSSDPDPDTPPEISDNEWEIRTGRGIYVLQETLPEFFDIGLITSVDAESGAPNIAGGLSTANIPFLEPEDTRQHADADIYSPHVRLSYTPPLELPAPFPKTFHVDGFQLYVASAGILRRTLNALYSDLSVSLTKMTVNSPESRSLSEPDSDSTHPRSVRQKSVVLRQVVAGVARVSGKRAEWEIESTYTFSPITGLILSHVVNSIHPAPHQAVYDSLNSTLGKLLGWGEAGPRPNPNGAAFKDSAPTRKSA